MTKVNASEIGFRGRTAPDDGGGLHSTRFLHALRGKSHKRWLVASQFVHRSLEAGTEKLWSEMHARDDVVRRGVTKP